MDGSPRRRGQLLVLVGALLGSLVGVTLGLVVDEPGAGVAAALAPDRRAAMAAATPGSQPPTSRSVGTGSDGPAERPGKGRGKDRDKSDKAGSEASGKDRAGKDKRKDKEPERH